MTRRAQTPPPKKRSGPIWKRWSDNRLLEVRLCDLGVQLEGTWLEPQLAQLRQELHNRQLLLRLHFWLSEEWFCPEATQGIAVPFFLAHQRLMQLERKQMQVVDGGNRLWCMKILRHEAGHAIRHAFGLHRRKRWRDLFGKASQTYPPFYCPRPTSRSHVLHLYHWYAQSHPDEDFAETFAVWLNPRSAWRRTYDQWPALEKLIYVDELMTELANRRPKGTDRTRVFPLRGSKQTLREYYAAKKAFHGEHFSRAYDDDLIALFTGGRTKRKQQSAAAFLRERQRKLLTLVARWTGPTQFTLNQVFRDMVGRARALGLKVTGPKPQLEIEFATLLAVRTVEYLHTTRTKHAL